ncbi:MAG TPA: FAD-dependent oxidoreductase [Allosphingosinicella sp.]|nr:FAD-dependent oxidoreductase [Allosphingosinicella sp.]
MRRTAALIVGGGPAGSAAAIALAQGGLEPVLVERSAGERDVVCGGFLGWDALAALRRLDVDAAALGARPIRQLRLVSGARSVTRALPKPAAGLSRRRLDAALLARAETAGAEVLRGRTARALEGGVVRLDDGEALACDALFLATGKHELRGAQREFGDREVSVGLRAPLPASPALEAGLAETIELHLFDGGYAGLLLQEDGSANLCLSAARARLTAAGSPAALVARLLEEAPLLRERVEQVPAQWEAIAGVAYGWRARETERGLFRLGDQAAVIASLAGDGIAIALNSGMEAAAALLSGRDAGAFQRAFARRAAWPVGIAEALRHLAEHRRERPLMMGLARLPGVARLAARLTRIG